MPQVASCMFMYLPALSCTVVHREREKERGKREGREGEGERRRKKFGRQGRPAKAFWKNFKSYIVLGQKKWIYSPGQSVTVPDINFRS